MNLSRYNTFLKRQKNSVIFFLPIFSNFRVVAGPNIYTGSVATHKGRNHLKIMFIHLSALKSRAFIIPGAMATINSRKRS